MNVEVFNRKGAVTIGGGAWISLLAGATEAGWQPEPQPEAVFGEEGSDQTHAEVLSAQDAAALARLARGRYPEPERYKNLPELLAILEGGEDVLTVL